MTLSERSNPPTFLTLVYEGADAELVDPNPETGSKEVEKDSDLFAENCLV